MGFLENIRWSINRRLEKKREMKVWAQWGDETQYHFNDPKISIGEKTYGIPTIEWYDDTLHLSIGKYCSIAKNVKILMGGNHHYEWVTTYPFYMKLNAYPQAEGKQNRSCCDTIIGNDVWIGYDVLILGGVSIGNGAVIGAGTVVSKDIPPYAIAAGNPVKILKYRFSEEVINKLQELKWWDWDENKIKKNIPLLLSENIEQL